VDRVAAQERPQQSPVTVVFSETRIYILEHRKDFCAYLVELRADNEDYILT
jgi:hypothetical protein